MRFITADLVDVHGANVVSCQTQFRQFGGHTAFHGPIRTIKTFEDNALLKDLLATPGDGAVLVVDGGGSLRTALIGDTIASSAVSHGWAGLVLFGAVRDSVALAQLPLGIKALGTNPTRSNKAATGFLDIPVTFGEATFRPGEWLYSDEDGLLVSAQSLPAA